MRSRTKRTVLAAALIVTGAGCGTGGRTSAPPAGDKSAFCALETKIDNAFGEALGSLGPQPTPDATAGALNRVAEANLATAHQERDVAPASIKNDLAVLIDAVDNAAHGDATDLMGERATTAAGRVNAFCGITHSG